MKILITGGAGFIGAALGQRLLDRGDTVHAVDTLNDYYEVSLKQARLSRLQDREGFSFDRLDIADRAAVAELFEKHQFDAVMNLAAQAGVRYSLENPAAYVDANLVGFGNILEGCRHSKVGHLVYASSSSVYGSNTKLPYSENDAVDHQVSLYAASKKANELMAHTYAHLYDLPCTGLRFFTVYGPWGRPDMAFFTFTQAMRPGEKIPAFNHGKMLRDFTYIDDIVAGVIRVIDSPARPDPDYSHDAPMPSSSDAPYRVYNIGNGRPVELLKYIEVLEDALGIKADKDMLPMQAGDVKATTADTSALERDMGYRPETTVEEGLARFAQWYRDYYK